ncbi:hypothetical protein B296_00047477, partial [Ensete ventricosum]
MRFTEGIRKLTGNTPGDHRKTHRKNTRGYQIGGMGSHRSSLGDSSKGSGSSLETRWEITGRRPENSPQECQRLSNWR